MENFIKIRESFVIRWLKALDSNRNERSIIDLEHVQSGETWRVTSIEDAAEMMKKVTDSVPNHAPNSNIGS